MCHRQNMTDAQKSYLSPLPEYEPPLADDVLPPSGWIRGEEPASEDPAGDDGKSPDPPRTVAPHSDNGKQGDHR
jgi:hypothetical protein